MIQVTNFKQFKELIERNHFVLVDIYADWCGPCKMMAPIVESFDEETKGEVKVAKVNVDENQDIAAEYRINSIPTLLLFKDGKLVDSAIGYRSLANLHEMVEKHN